MFIIYSRVWLDVIEEVIGSRVYDVVLISICSWRVFSVAGKPGEILSVVGKGTLFGCSISSCIAIDLPTVALSARI